MESQLLAVTQSLTLVGMTSFRSGFGGGLEGRNALSMTASTTGVFVSDANPMPHRH